MKKYYVYILRCNDRSYYTGLTSDLTSRISEHSIGMYRDAYTFGRRPVQLVYLADFTEIQQAIDWGKHIKRWGRKKKEALIRSLYDELPGLAVNGDHRRIRFVRSETAQRVMVSTVEPWHADVSPLDCARDDTSARRDTRIGKDTHIQCDTIASPDT